MINYSVVVDRSLDYQRQVYRPLRGTRDEAEAERQRAELEARLLLGLPVTSAGKLAGAELYWEDFREAYTQHLISSGHRKSTIETAESRLDVAERIVRPTTLKEMARHDTMELLQSRLLAGAESRNKRPRSPHSVRGYMRHVRGALNWAVEKGWLDRLPRVRAVSVDETDAMKGRPLVGEEVDRFLTSVTVVCGDASAKSWKYMIRGIVASGLRLSELMTISWDIPHTIHPMWTNGQRPTLWFPAHLQRNKKTEVIPLNPWFESLLHETVPELRTGWVFNPEPVYHRLGRKSKKERLSVDWVGEILARIGRKAGIVVEAGDPRTGAAEKCASAHDLRRTFAQQMHDAGVDESLVKVMMRHKDVNTTRRHYLVANIQRQAAQIQEKLAGVTQKVGHTSEVAD